MINLPTNWGSMPSSNTIALISSSEISALMIIVRIIWLIKCMKAALLKQLLDLSTYFQVSPHMPERQSLIIEQTSHGYPLLGYWSVQTSISLFFPPKSRSSHWSGASWFRNILILAPLVLFCQFYKPERIMFLTFTFTNDFDVYEMIDHMWARIWDLFVGELGSEQILFFLSRFWMSIKCRAFVVDVQHRYPVFNFSALLKLQTWSPRFLPPSLPLLHWQYPLLMSRVPPAPLVKVLPTMLSVINSIL